MIISTSSLRSSEYKSINNYVDFPVLVNSVALISRVFIPPPTETDDQNNTNHYLSLAKLSQIILSIPMDKTWQLTNWEKRPLEYACVCYAALDVCALVRMTEIILEKTGMYLQSQSPWFNEEIRTVWLNDYCCMTYFIFGWYLIQVLFLSSGISDLVTLHHLYNQVDQRANFEESVTKWVSSQSFIQSISSAYVIIEIICSDQREQSCRKILIMDGPLLLRPLITVTGKNTNGRVRPQK